MWTVYVNTPTFWAGALAMFLVLVFLVPDRISRAIVSVRNAPWWVIPLAVLFVLSGVRDIAAKIWAAIPVIVLDLQRAAAAIGTAISRVRIDPYSLVAVVAGFLIITICVAILLARRGQPQPAPAP